MLIWVDTKKVLFLCDDAQEVIIFILALRKICISTLKHYHFINNKTTLKQQ